MSTASENHSFMMQLLDKAYDAAVSGSVFQEVSRVLILPKTWREIIKMIMMSR